jgi:hypothetical protein
MCVASATLFTFDFFEPLPVEVEVSDAPSRPTLACRPCGSSRSPSPILFRYARTLTGLARGADE